MFELILFFGFFLFACGDETVATFDNSISDTRALYDVWTVSPQAQIRNGRLDLTSSLPKSRGFLWTKQVISAVQWTIELTYNLRDAPSLALWVADQGLVEGDFHGMSGKWRGLGILFTKDEEHPNIQEIRVMVNDGKLIETEEQMLGATKRILNSSCVPDEDMKFKVSYLYDKLVIQKSHTPEGEEDQYSTKLTLDMKLPTHRFTVGVSTQVGSEAISHLPNLNKLIVVKKQTREQRKKADEEAQKEQDIKIEKTKQSVATLTHNELNERVMEEVTARATAFSLDLSSSGSYIESLQEGLMQNLKKFDDKFATNVKNIKSTIVMTQLKITEIEEDHQKIDNLELQFATLQGAMTHIAANLDVLQLLLSEGHKMLNQNNLTPKPLWQKVDLLVWILVVQVFIGAIFFVWKTMQSKSISRV